MSIGERIKLEREHKGLTQKDLAKRAGVALITISQYERGKRQPRIDVLKQIADSLGVSVEVFLDTEFESLTPIMETLDYQLKFVSEEEKALIINALQSTLEQISRIKMRSTSTQLLRFFADFLKNYGDMITQNFQMRAAIEHNGKDGTKEYLEFLQCYENAQRLLRKHKETLLDESLLNFNGGDELKKLIYGDGESPGNKEG